MNRKEYQPDHMSISPKGCTFIVGVILFIILLVGLSSCGPAYHVRRAEHHINKAIEKGADIKKDTITFHFRTPEIKWGTTLKPQWLDGAPIPLWRDTLTAKDEKTGATVKAKINLKKDCPEDCIETVTLQGDCPPQDQSIDVPCETVQAGYTGWEMIILAIACLAAGAVLGRLFWKSA